MSIPLAIGGALVLMIFGGWIVGDVEFAIYPLLGAPLAGFFLGVLGGRELPVFFLTAGVTALCFALWGAARTDLRRAPEDVPRTSGPAQLEPR